MTTREDILKAYELSKDGKIQTKGMFLNERVYAPYYHELFAEGKADRVSGSYCRFEVTDADRAMFPELKHKREVRFSMDAKGYFCEV
jgi:hypothetical protein